MSRPPPERATTRQRTSDLLLVVTILGLTAAALQLAGHSGEVWHMLGRIEAEPWRRWIIRPAMVLALVGAGLTVVRSALWYTYRPWASATPERAPAMTVVIPAYNEGAMVGRTIDSVAAARYPHDRLQIVAIDDGSRDDTWEHIEAAARRYPELVRTIRFPRNRGKRAALAAGFEHARGDVLVTIDSDSLIDVDTLLAIAAPFTDARVGAVAGRVDVLNRYEGLIPRMLHVRFRVAFDYLRAAQSTYGFVYCCPGALAAYRAEVVHRVLPRWVEQTFCGVPCTIGEDRAMTNFIVAEGLRSVYQRTAVVSTLAPQSYRGLCKMFLRWDRSYIREEFHTAALLPRLEAPALLFAALDLMVNDLGYLFGYASLLLLARAAAADLGVLRMLAEGIGVAGVINTLYFLRTEKSFEFLFGVVFAYFSFIALSWIMPYAALTVRARGWLTR